MCGLHVASAHYRVLSVESTVAQLPRDPIDCLSDGEKQLRLGQKSRLTQRSCHALVLRARVRASISSRAQTSGLSAIVVFPRWQSCHRCQDLVDMGRGDHSTEIAGEHIYECKKQPFLLQNGASGFGLHLRQNKARITCIPLPGEPWRGSQPSEESTSKLETVPLGESLCVTAHKWKSGT